MLRRRTESCLQGLRDLSTPHSLLSDQDRLLGSRPRPDALFAPGEIAGVTVLDELLSRGIEVPDEMLVSTTRDLGRVTTTAPPMTAMEWDFPEIGRRAARLLLDLIDGARTAPYEEVIATSLEPRASTARQVFM